MERAARQPVGEPAHTNQEGVGAEEVDAAMEEEMAVLTTTPYPSLTVNVESALTVGFID